MLRSYLRSDEYIYLYNKFNTKKFNSKNSWFFFLGIFISLLAVLSLIASFIYTIKLLIVFIILFIFSAIILGISFYENKKFIFNNSITSLEYAVTSKRILLYDLFNRKLYEYSIFDFKKIIVRTGPNNTGKGDLILVNEYNKNVFSFCIDNDYITIDNDRISFNSLKNIYKYKNQLLYNLYVFENNITDITNINNYLLPDEKLVFETSFHDTLKIHNFNTIFFLIIYYIYIIISEFIYYPIQEFFIFGIFNSFLPLVALFTICWIRTIYASIKYRNKIYNFKYAITNQRVIFLDLTNYILYSGFINNLSYVRLLHYNKFSDYGDIVLTVNGMPTNLMFNDGGFIGKTSDLNTLFPEHYENNLFLFDYNTTNMPKIRLYRIKDPRLIINTYIEK